MDVVCGDHLLDHFQSLKDIQNSAGKDALQVGENIFLIMDFIVSNEVMSDPVVGSYFRTVFWCCTLVWFCLPRCEHEASELESIHLGCCLFIKRNIQVLQ